MIVIGSNILGQHECLHLSDYHKTLLVLLGPASVIFTASVNAMIPNT
jgi:hypothetical protein